MIKVNNSAGVPSLDEMMDCLRNPTKDKRCLSELDIVIDEIIDRNPEWVDEIMRIVEEKTK